MPALRVNSGTASGADRDAQQKSTRAISERKPRNEYGRHGPRALRCPITALSVKGAHEDANACDDESPGGPKVLPLTETALRQFRSEQPKQKKTARRRSLEEKRRGRALTRPSVPSSCDPQSQCSADRLVLLEYRASIARLISTLRTSSRSLCLCEDGVRRLGCIFRLRRNLAFHDNPPA